MAHIAVIVGHTSQRPGAVSIGGVSEYAFNSIVAGHLESELADLGHQVSRVARGLPNDLAGLPAKVNATGADLAVELHFNSFSDPAANGCETLYWHSSEDGRQLAKFVHEAVLQSFSLRNRGLKPIRAGQRGSVLLQRTAMPCILTEPFFGSNPTNWKRMKDAHAALAAAYAHGITACAHWKEIAPTIPVVSSTTYPPHVQAVIDAWVQPGPNPDLHERAQEELSQSWPALANAIRRLAAQA